ncbi:MAG: general glycosylation pathway protein [Deltaproteobacteria bacterium]|nr:general glycosylation pathway protein [Deltaproteobacteria bacterium]
MGRVVYGLSGLSLALISLTMMAVGLWGIWLSVHEKTLLVKALLDGIGLMVIGMAVFDVSKFLLEEEVLHNSGTKSPSKQRETLIKFLVIIAIAVSLEALVFIFDAGKKEISHLIYPTFLLVAAVLVVIGLGVYQKLTQDEAK